MKKSTSNILIIAASCFVIGVLCCVIALSMGVADEAPKQFGHLDKLVNVNDEILNIDWSYYGDNVIRGSVEKQNITNGEMPERIKLELGKAEARIEASEDDDIYVTTTNNAKLGYKIHDGELTLATVGNHGKKTVITVLLPERAYDRVKLELGAGEFSVACPIDSDEVVVESGAGEVAFGKVVADTLDVELGAGEITFDEIDVDELKLEVAAGNAAINGAIRKKGKAEVAAGNVALMLAGSEDDYTYKADGGMGNFTIGGKTVSGFALSREGGNGDIALDFECAMGNITVDFEK